MESSWALEDVNDPSRGSLDWFAVIIEALTPATIKKETDEFGHV
jgi:hypothetical protein